MARQHLVLLWLSLVSLHLGCCCLSKDEVKGHPHLSLASILGDNPSVAKAKRGGGWGFPSKTVGAELLTLPVEWWYNWGNYIPNADAANVTQVLLGQHLILTFETRLPGLSTTLDILLAVLHCIFSPDCNVSKICNPSQMKAWVMCSQKLAGTAL